jgi:hypothetical protein
MFLSNYPDRDYTPETANHESAASQEHQITMEARNDIIELLEPLDYQNRNVAGLAYTLGQGTIIEFLERQRQEDERLDAESDYRSVHTLKGEYVSGVKLILILLSMVLVQFVLMLDLSIIATV